MMDEYIENSLRKLLDTLEQAESAAYRNGRYSDLIALTKAHIVAMRFWYDEEDAISNVKNIYVPKPPKEDNNGQ